MPARRPHTEVTSPRVSPCHCLWYISSTPARMCAPARPGPACSGPRLPGAKCLLVAAPQAARHLHRCPPRLPSSLPLLVYHLLPSERAACLGRHCRQKPTGRLPSTRCRGMRRPGVADLRGWEECQLQRLLLPQTLEHCCWMSPDASEGAMCTLLCEMKRMYCCLYLSANSGPLEGRSRARDARMQHPHIPIALARAIGRMHRTASWRAPLCSLAANYRNWSSTASPVRIVEASWTRRGAVATNLATRALASRQSAPGKPRTLRVAPGRRCSDRLACEHASRHVHS